MVLKGHPHKGSNPSPLVIFLPGLVERNLKMSKKEKFLTVFGQILQFCPVFEHFQNFAMICFEKRYHS
jgi:hypothetical protein